MSMLTLTLTQAPRFGLSLETLTPEQLRGLSLDKIKRLRLQHGRRSLALGDVFTISGSVGEDLEFRGTTDKLHRIGAGMSLGSITVQGSAGAELGLGMRGGAIRVRGNGGDCVGAGMRGGRIEVSGSVGDGLGGGQLGATMGMRGGQIHIGKHAGARVGDRMRRGMITVAGNVGPYCGSRMIAGTIVVFGQTAPGLGSGMRRGSIVLLQAPAELPASFVETGSFRLGFLALLARELVAAKTGLGNKLRKLGEVRRIVGDAACGGLGEILIAID